LAKRKARSASAASRKATKKPAPRKRRQPGTGRLFGTDGVRGEAGSGALAPERVFALGRALGTFLVAHAPDGRRPMVLVGVDPRPSADMVGLALASGLITERCDVHWPGMMSTPEVAFLTARGPYQAGVVITASHNPARDNGIKIFGQDGHKLPAAIEHRLERAVLTGKAAGDTSRKGGRYGWLNIARERHYATWMVSTFRQRFAAARRQPLSIVIDAAFGARSVDAQILAQIVHSLAFGSTVPEFRVGASMHAAGNDAGNALDVYFLNASSPSYPDMHNRINEGCGSLYPEGCAHAVRELRADLGICFDGDGDRCVLVDENGEVRDGDYILALLAADMKARGALKNDTVVSTTMANLGLERALRESGISLVRTDVGDKYVAEAMQKSGAVIGGEQSGHIILYDDGHVAGDGLYTALRVIEVMLRTGKPLSELCAPVRKFPQTIVNLRVKAKPALSKLKNLSRAQRELAHRLGNRGRINIRYSGTEPLLRIMVEAEDRGTLDSVASELTAAARSDLP
jgi:phosphoglucosamine mutase